MFDKLIESEPEGADFKNRRNYFMVSSLVVGALFVTAVVISIYAADFGLGHDSLELVEMIAPVQPAPVAPETPQPRISTSQSRDQIPTRQINMVRIDESPIVPKSTSVTRNEFPSRPDVPFRLDTNDTDRSNGNGRSETGPGTGEGGIAKSQEIAESNVVPEPPPVKPPPAKIIVSGGVVNGKAKNLPIPSYTAAAKAVGASGKVDVQVMIDENGKVVSASAISGHLLLRREAEQAARGAIFSPTYLSKVPVKVTGVIVYNFKR